MLKSRKGVASGDLRIRFWRRLQDLHRGLQVFLGQGEIVVPVQIFVPRLRRDNASHLQVALKTLGVHRDHSAPGDLRVRGVILHLIGRGLQAESHLLEFRVGELSDEVLGGLDDCVGVALILRRLIWSFR